MMGRVGIVQVGVTISVMIERVWRGWLVIWKFESLKGLWFQGNCLVSGESWETLLTLVHLFKVRVTRFVLVVVTRSGVTVWEIVDAALVMVRVLFTLVVVTIVDVATPKSDIQAIHRSKKADLQVAVVDGVVVCVYVTVGVIVVVSGIPTLRKKFLCQANAVPLLLLPIVMMLQFPVVI